MPPDGDDPDRRPLDLITEMSAVANYAEDPTEAFLYAVRRTATFLGWPVGHAWRARPDNGFESTCTWYVEDLPEIRRFTEASECSVLEPGVGLPARVVDDPRSVLVGDLAGQQDFRRTLTASEAGLRTALLVPVMVGRRVGAVLEFYTTRDTTVDPTTLTVLNQVGLQLGRVIERDRARLDLEVSRARQKQVLDTANDAFVAMGRTGRITVWNKAAEKMFGWDAEEVLGRTVSEVIIPPRFREAHNKKLRTVLENGHVASGDRRSEALLMHRDGHELPVEISRWMIDESEPTHLYGFIRDLSDRHRFEQQLRGQAQFDPLTHVASREHLISHLCEVLGRRKQIKGDVAVVFADIDQFGLINDSLGHGVGDEVLVTVAARFAGVIEETDFIARLAADEFVIVRENVTSRNQVEVLAQQLIGSLQEPLQLVDDTVFVTVSIGSAFLGSVCSGTAASNAERLIHAAGSAMLSARSSGSGYHQSPQDVHCNETPVRRHIVSDLRNAFHQGEFRIHYQPQVDIADGTTIGVEALLRWIHPEQGLLPPVTFIDALERSGMIIPVGRWVIEQVVEQARIWQSERVATGPPLEVWVNVSTRQFAQSDLVSTIDDVLDGAGLDPSRVQLGVEVTESSLMGNPEHALTRLHDLCDLGVDLAIDDFGTGYSSLSYLKHFPATALKIDRSFILGIAENDIDRSIVEGIVGLARSLDLQTIAEGVETEAQLNALRDLGIDIAQGYLFSRPQSASALTELISNRSHRTVPTRNQYRPASPQTPVTSSAATGPTKCSSERHSGGPTSSSHSAA